MKPYCCFTDGNISCGKDATWELFTGTVLTCDNATHACDDHLVKLLEPAVSTVYPISMAA